jgi:integrase
MPKQVAPLTALQINNLKPQPGKQIELSDGQVSGLRVRMNPSGVMSWSLLVRAANGVRKRFDIGVGYSLADARLLALSLRQEIRAGQDPTASRRLRRERARAAEKGEGTLSAVVEDYFTLGAGQVLSSKGEQERRIKDVFSGLLNTPAAEIELPQLQRMADGHQSPSSAARAVAYLKPLLKWAAKRGLMSAELKELEKPVERSVSDTEGQRVLTRDELAKILPVLGIDGYGLAAKLMLLTGCRRGEADGATWGEIDLENRLWTIPPARRKDTRSRNRKKQVAAQPHVIPLSQQAVGLLSKLPSGKPDELVFRNKAGGQLGNWQKWQLRMMARCGVTGWDRHALRRTCATMAGELGAEPHVISVVLGHKHIGSQLTSIYNKARYQPEHKAILDAIGREIDMISGSNPDCPTISTASALQENHHA